MGQLPEKKSKKIIKPNKLTVLLSVILTTLLIGTFVINMVGSEQALKLKVRWRPCTYTIRKYTQESPPLPDPWKAIVCLRTWPPRRATEIDPRTILLEGKYRPESAPYPILRRLMLVLPFDGYDVLKALMTKVPHLAPGQYRICLVITGRLYDGTPFRGSGTITLKVLL